MSFQEKYVIAVRWPLHVGKDDPRADHNWDIWERGLFKEDVLEIYQRLTQYGADRYFEFALAHIIRTKDRKNKIRIDRIISVPDRNYKSAIMS